VVAFADGRDYIFHMRHLCESGSYPDRGALPFFRAPGLPLFLLVVSGCDPEAVAPMKAALATAGVGSVLAVLALARRLRGERAALIAGLGAAVWPPLLLQDSDVSSEALFTPLLSGALVLTLAGLAGSSVLAMAAAGLTIGAAALTRPTALAVIPFLCVAVMLRRDVDRARRVLLAASLGLAATLTIAPWSLRNYLRYGELVIVNDAGPHTLWWGSHPLLSKPGGRPFLDRAEEFEREVGSAAKDVRGRADTPSGRGAIWRQMWAYLEYTLRKAIGYWRPWLDPSAHRMRDVLASAACIVPLYVLAILGFRQLREDAPWEARLIVAFLMLGWAVHVPFHVVMRLRIPFSDPAMLALAGIALDRALPRPWRFPGSCP
jgi:4-amino-4-deoxy-L-arabinose transferase-like glycosyltransferase